MVDKDGNLIVFENFEIRRVWLTEEWHFSVVDIFRVLSDTKDTQLAQA
jgi:hypothetical protein